MKKRNSSKRGRRGLLRSEQIFFRWKKIRNKEINSNIDWFIVRNKGYINIFELYKYFY